VHLNSKRMRVKRGMESNNDTASNVFEAVIGIEVQHSSLQYSCVLPTAFTSPGTAHTSARAARPPVLPRLCCLLLFVTAHIPEAKCGLRATVYAIVAIAVALVATARSKWTSTAVRCTS
jgi:hypothetical protein